MPANTDYLVSPVGQIQFLALNRKVTKGMAPDSPEGYAVRIKFDSATTEGAAFKKTINAVNPNLLGSKHVDNKGEYTVRAFSKFLPEVLDATGNEIEDLPDFYGDSTGTASMIIQVYTGNSMGGAITLSGIVIHSLETSENHTGNTVTSGRDNLLQLMREKLKNNS